MTDNANTKETLTHEEVNALEDSLREVQRQIESAGQKICGLSGEHANHIWNRLTAAADEIGEIIGSLYLVRPY